MRYLGRLPCRGLPYRGWGILRPGVGAGLPPEMRIRVESRSADQNPDRLQIRVALDFENNGGDFINAERHSQGDRQESRIGFSDQFDQFVVRGVCSEEKTSQPAASSMSASILPPSS